MLQWILLILSLLTVFANGYDSSGKFDFKNPLLIDILF